MAEAAASTDAFLNTYLSRLPPRVAASFTAEQLAAIKTMFAGRAVGTHGLEFRRTFRLFGRAYYLCILGGRCRRAQRHEASLAGPQLLPMA